MASGVEGSLGAGARVSRNLGFPKPLLPKPAVLQRNPKPEVLHPVARNLESSPWFGICVLVCSQSQTRLGVNSGFQIGFGPNKGRISGLFGPDLGRG